MKTLCIDIGGTGIKAIVLGPDGSTITQRTRVETPDPAVPDAVLAVLDDIAKGQGEFDRVSIGFPGVVKDGMTWTAPNLDEGWTGVEFAAEMERRLGKPVRVANDADIQGLGVIEGKGFEMVVTLGTGMGSGLYLDGRCVPNLELGHHPFRKGETYEDRIANRVRTRIGHQRWNTRVRASLDPRGISAKKPVRASSRVARLSRR
jgi:polyphosphate glucokinase